MNNNPTGINQYSGKGGKGGKKITIMDSRTGLHHQITRDVAASRIKTARKVLKTATSKTSKITKNTAKADIANLVRASKRKNG